MRGRDCRDWSCSCHLVVAEGLQILEACSSICSCNYDFEKPIANLYTEPIEPGLNSSAFSTRTVVFIVTFHRCSQAENTKNQVMGIQKSEFCLKRADLNNSSGIRLMSRIKLTFYFAHLAAYPSN